MEEGEKGRADLGKVAGGEAGDFAGGKSLDGDGADGEVNVGKGREDVDVKDDADGCDDDDKALEAGP